jgi:predicted nucleotidyltransferase component of viral defense system
MTLKGFSSDTIEKMKRLCDLLLAIQSSEFISKRLSLYGGTALNFLYLNNPRLSEDLDYNYRHIDKEDWSKIRDKIDLDLKWILDSLGYKKNEIKINSLYNQCRFHLNYISETGVKDDLKIEIGYMRRSPDLNKDCIKSFNHLTKEGEIRVMTPFKEELFANKFATMISRSKVYLNPRDIFDVYSISKENFNQRLFLDLVAIESMLMDMSYNTLIQIKERLMNGKPSGKIEHLINRKINFENIISDVVSFSNKTIKDLSSYKLDKTIDCFYDSGRLNLGAFRFKNKLNPNLKEHPQLEWLRKKTLN